MVKTKVTFPRYCPQCGSGTLWFEQNEDTTQQNVEYECDVCGMRYTWDQLASIMLQKGLQDSGKVVRYG